MLLFHLEWALTALMLDKLFIWAFQKTYIQQTGRAGRDGNPSIALLLKNKISNRLHHTKNMIDYQKKVPTYS